MVLGKGSARDERLRLPTSLPGLLVLSAEAASLFSADAASERTLTLGRDVLTRDQSPSARLEKVRGNDYTWNLGELGAVGGCAGHRRHVELQGFPHFCWRLWNRPREGPTRARESLLQSDKNLIPKRFGGNATRVDATHRSRVVTNLKYRSPLVPS